MIEPEVTVITITYNHEEYIGHCIESVIGQTFKSWEQIIIDDGSTDATWNAIGCYAAADSRIRAIRQEHVGPFKMADTYNRALQMARGRLIAIVEGDDFWPTEKLSAQVPLHDCPDVLLSYGCTVIVDEQDEIIGEYSPVDSKVLTSQALKREYLFRRSGILPVSVLIDRQHLQRSGGFLTTAMCSENVEFPTTDYPTFVRLLSEEGLARSVNRRLGYWRKHRGQTTQAFERLFHEGMYNYARLIVSREDSGIRRLLSIREVYLAHRGRVSGYYLSELRKELVRRNRKAVWAVVLRMLWWGGTVRRVQAIVGLVAAFFRLDLEEIFKWLERRSRGQLRSQCD